jgi:hypothetical protein
VRAAARGIDDDRRQGLGDVSRVQPLDQRRREIAILFLAAQVMHDRAAASGDGHHLKTEPVEQSLRCGRDLPTDDRLHATGEKCDAAKSRD